jgi:adenosylcobinamide amidohydrolase
MKKVKELKLKDFFGEPKTIDACIHSNTKACNECLNRLAPKDNWEDDWTGYCQTYLKRYGITDEVAIITIAGNLEQVVKKILAAQRKEIEGEIEELRLNFSKDTGAINNYVAFGRKLKKEVDIYNLAIENVKQLLKKIK